MADCALPLEEVASSGGLSRSLLFEFIRTQGEMVSGSLNEGISGNRSLSYNSELNESIYFACERHEPDLELIDRIISVNPKALETPDRRGWLPIHHGAMANSYKSTKFLLERYPEGAKVSQDDGFLPLHMAVYFDDIDLEVVAMLLDAYPEGAKHKSTDGRTPLHVAVQNSCLDLSVIRLLVSSNPEAVQETTSKGQLPLHLCLENEHCTFEIFSFLLQSFPGAVCAKDAPPRSRLPLHYAIAAVTQSIINKETITDIIKLLVDEYPSGVGVPDHIGKTPIHMHLQHCATSDLSRNHAVMRCSESDVGNCGQSDVDSDHEESAYTPRAATDQSCSADSASIGSTGSDLGEAHYLELILDYMLRAFPSALKVKCSLGKLPIVEYLEYAVNPSVEIICKLSRSNREALMIGDRLGYTPLHILLNKPMFSLEIFEGLLSHCPETSTVVSDSGSYLPIHIALRNTRPDVQLTAYQSAKRLLEVYPGAADQSDENGFLPLHLAVCRATPDTSLIRRLLEIFPLGAESTTADTTLLLPIHCAVSALKPNKSVVDILLSAYPEGLDRLCAAGLTPLDHFFLNMKNQFSKKNFLRSATPSLKAPFRKYADSSPVLVPVQRFLSGSIDAYEMPECARPSSPLTDGTSASVHHDSNSPETIFSSDSSNVSGRVSVELLKELNAGYDDLKYCGSKSGNKHLDTGDDITGRNNNVMAYFKEKSDEDVLYVALELLKSNNFEVTDDILVMFGGRLWGARDIAEEDKLMFRGDFGGSVTPDACQCVIQ